MKKKRSTDERITLEARYNYGDDKNISTIRCQLTCK